ncbi:MAG TPA: CDP-glucose 4,6-dehydratase [Burkholderiales bacterium]|jgi:CDP-glucose 4,6-dehydratase|nr:CDP-glucose 4,6-dehydratase [Burkholderiales bacterium]
MDALKSVFAGRTVLVTGDTGFKGAWLSLWLHLLGAKVVGLSLPAERSEDLFPRLGLGERILHQDGDIRDLDTVLSVMRKFEPEFCFHLAAQSLVRRSYLEPKLTFDTNVGGSVNVLEAIRHTPSVRVAIYVTSDKCYRNREWVFGYREEDELGGRDPYSASKAAAELLFSSYLDSFFGQRGELGIGSVRAGNVIGGGDWSEDRIVPDCIRALRADAPIRLRNPGATRPWQHVLEPLGGYLLLATKLFSDSMAYRGAWNFGPRVESGRSVEALVRAIVGQWGSGSIEVAPPTAANPHEARLLHLSCDKSYHSLGWQPRWNFERTVTETVDWYRRINAGESAWDVTSEQIHAYMRDLND